MHAVVMETLEEYLSGLLEPATQRKIEAHLSSCVTCREEIQSMPDLSVLFESLRSEETWDVAPGFYAGVAAQLDAQNAERSAGGFFGLSLAFGRRLVFASLLVLAMLGGYLATHEPEFHGLPSPEAILAQEDS